MKRPFLFLYAYRVFILFVLLELLSVVFIVSQKFDALSTPYTVGIIHRLISEIKNYPSLKAKNAKLLHDNAVLRKQLLQAKKLKPQSNTAIAEQYDYIPVHVINNSIINTKNYITLDKGTIHGVMPGMGVVSEKGIIGKVKAVSEHFATVISLLHTSIKVSAKLEVSGVLGTVEWPGNNPLQVQMLHVPRHVHVAPGDVVVTSGYNAIFTEGTVIGYIEQAVLSEGTPFYDIRLNVNTDFSTLQHAYVVKNALKKEKNTLEQKTKEFYE